MSQPTPDERVELLAAYEGLRVADVRDGLDWHMMHSFGSMDADIRPLFRTRACGIARTVRCVAFEGPIPVMNPDEAREWITWYSDNVNVAPYLDELVDGDFLVIDQGGLNIGMMGSNNALYGMTKGARGYVTNGGVRDTDELIVQKVPFWSRSIAQVRTEGRLRYESHDTTVHVAGVQVNPGDMVVADGDGVVVVPREKALSVAKIARKELESDKAGRRGLYRAAGLPEDDTVR